MLLLVWLLACVGACAGLQWSYEMLSLCWIVRLGHRSALGGTWSATTRRVPHWLKLRLAAAQHYRCGRCFARLPATWELDHVRPVCKGGALEVRNMLVLDLTCHRLKTHSVDLQ